MCAACQPVPSGTTPQTTSPAPMRPSAPPPTRLAQLRTTTSSTPLSIQTQRCSLPLVCHSTTRLACVSQCVSVSVYACIAGNQATWLITTYGQVYGGFPYTNQARNVCKSSSSPTNKCKIRHVFILSFWLEALHYCRRCGMRSRLWHVLIFLLTSADSVQWTNDGNAGNPRIFLYVASMCTWPFCHSISSIAGQLAASFCLFTSFPLHLSIHFDL